MVEAKQSLIPVENIAQSIMTIRGQRVILDSDLARLYGASTTRLNEQVKRNNSRFPDDFMFQLTDDENRLLMSQIAISKPGRGGRRTLPYVFTEHGAVMAASVLNTPRAVEASIYVVRAFIRLRDLLATHAELSQKFKELQARVDGHDEQIWAIIEAIGQLLAPPETPERKIGFLQVESEQ